MPAQAPSVEVLTQRIEGLYPHEVESELDPIMRYGSDCILTRLLNRNSLQPNLDLLRAIGGAAERSGSQKTADSITSKAVGSVVWVISSGRFEAIDLMRLAHEAEVMNESIASPDTRASELRDLSEAMLEASGRPDQRVTYAYRAVDLMDKAADMAKQIDNDGAHRSQSTVLSQLAEQAVEHVSKIDSIIAYSVLKGSPRDEHLNQLAYAQPVAMFEATAELLDAQPSHEARDETELARAMIRSAGKVAEFSPELHEKFAQMAVDQIDRVIETYSNPKGLRKLKPSKKCQLLTSLGSDLMMDIHEKYSDSAGDSANLNMLIGKTMQVFELAYRYAQHAGKMSHKLMPTDSGRDLFSANRVSTAAWRLGEIDDTPSSKRLYEISYDMAQIQDADSLSGSDRQRDTGDVLKSIERAAESADTIEATFELQALLYGLEAKRVGEGYRSHNMEVTARQFLRQVTGAPSPSVKFDEIDKSFVEGVVRVANSDGGGQWAADRLNGLYSLRRHVGEEVQAKIDETTSYIKAEIAKREQPVNETDRVAQEILSLFN